MRKWTILFFLQKKSISVSLECFRIELVDWTEWAPSGFLKMEKENVTAEQARKKCFSTGRIFRYKDVKNGDSQLMQTAALPVFNAGGNVQKFKM